MISLAYSMCSLLPLQHERILLLRHIFRTYETQERLRKFPHTGLDSTTAVTVIEALKNIAVNRKSTLIVTIHQPSAKLFALFDKCLFLAGNFLH